MAKFDKGYAQYVADRDWDTGQPGAKPAPRAKYGQAVEAQKVVTGHSPSPSISVEDNGYKRK